jgi:hypothetical protein
VPPLPNAWKPPPSGLIRTEEGYVARRSGFVTADSIQGMKCRSGHFVKEHGRMVEAGIRCEKILRTGKRCGLFLYVLAGVPPRNKRILWVADVESHDELIYLEDRGLTGEQVLLHFGAHFPPPLAGTSELLPVVAPAVGTVVDSLRS